MYRNQLHNVKNFSDYMGPYRSSYYYASSGISYSHP
jgi:hypothetical protein